MFLNYFARLRNLCIHSHAMVVLPRKNLHFYGIRFSLVTILPSGVFMPKTNFVSNRGTPWGIVISALIRAYGSTNPEKVRDIKFNDIDVNISLNGEVLDEETYKVFVNVLNKEGNLSAVSEVREKLEDLLNTLRSHVTDVSPEHIASLVMDDVVDRISNVDLAYLVQDHVSSGDYSNSEDMGAIFTKINEMSQVLNQV